MRNSFIMFRKVMDIIMLVISGLILGLILGLCSQANAAPAKKLETAGPYKIAVIDSGHTFFPYSQSAFKLCKTGHYDFNSEMAIVGPDEVGHGSFVTELINQEAKTENICFLIYKVFGNKVESVIEAVDRALLMSLKEGAIAVNMSLYMNHYSSKTKKIMQRLGNRGVKMFVSAGNFAVDLNKTCKYYPVCYKDIKNMVVVGAKDSWGEIATYSNTGAMIDVYENGDLLFMSRGTSFAAPRALGKWINFLELK